MSPDDPPREVQSFRDLHVWRRGIDLAELIYQTCGTFPKHELYGLTSQLQRSATSVPANVAEGSRRGTTKEFLHFISIALGSLAELETHCVVAQRVKYLDDERATAIFSLVDEIGRMLR